MVQQSNKKILCYGEILWDLLPDGKKLGGAPFNVAYHLKNLGLNSYLISKIGTDQLGQETLALVKEKGLHTTLLQQDKKHPTSKVETKIDEHHEVSYDIIDNVAWDHIRFTDQLAELAPSADYLVFGSLATRNTVTRETLYKLLDYPLTKVIDVNLRPPYYSKSILKDLLEKADIVKLNETELKILADWFSKDKKDLKQNMCGLAEFFNLDLLITTYGAKGGYVWHKGEVLFEPGHKVSVADTVGSGDSFLAGFLYEYINGASVTSALKTANKVGAFITTKHGGSPNYNKEEVLNFKS